MLCYYKTGLHNKLLHRKRNIFQEKFCVLIKKHLCGIHSKLIWMVLNRAIHKELKVESAGTQLAQIDGH